MSELVRILDKEHWGMIGVKRNSDIFIPGFRHDRVGDTKINRYQLDDIPNWVERKPDEWLMRNHHTAPVYHFTSVKKLESILETGLLMSRELARDVKGYEEFGDNRDESVSDKVRTTWLPNNPILAKYEGYKLPSEADHKDQVFPPCILEIDHNTVFLDSAIYFDGNSGARFTRSGKDLEFFLSINFQQMRGFVRRIDFDSTTGNPATDELRKEYDQEEFENARQELKNRKQAEVQFPLALPVNFVSIVYFRSAAEMLYAVASVPNLLSYKFKISMDHTKFTDRRRLESVAVSSEPVEKISYDFGVNARNGVQKFVDNGYVVNGNDLFLTYDLRMGFRPSTTTTDVTLVFRSETETRPPVILESRNGMNMRKFDVSGLKKGEWEMSLYFGERETYRTNVKFV